MSESGNDELTREDGHSRATPSYGGATQCWLASPGRDQREPALRSDEERKICFWGRCPSCGGCIAGVPAGSGSRFATIDWRREWIVRRFPIAAFEGLPGSAEPSCFATQTAWKIQKRGEQAWKCWCHACVQRLYVISITIEDAFWFR